MKIYSIKRTQTLPITQRAAWDFFSSPKNLDMITPKRMKFEILSISGGDKMYAGQIIRYKLQIFSFWTVSWVSEITHVQEPDFFVDDQLFGPYALWHHQHRFRTVPGGVEMTDEIHYAIPFGWLGRLANWLFVGREVNAIFEFRYHTLEQYFQKTVSS
jgi:ligand-binding SRPBCC domain-containing protein